MENLSLQAIELVKDTSRCVQHQPLVILLRSLQRRKEQGKKMIYLGNVVKLLVVDPNAVVG
jgi:hypothetical protein